MPRRAQRRLKRVSVKLAKRTKIVYKKKKNKMAKCRKCKSVLHGTAFGRIIEVKKLSKSEKRPTRIYAGNLCASCVRELIKEKIFKMFGGA